jgi:hypothetical protein
VYSFNRSHFIGTTPLPSLRVNPTLSLYYTSPLLVLYALALVLLQYIYSLDLTRYELHQRQSLGLECSVNTTDGCRSLVIGIKTAFACVFFASFHEFVKILKGEWRRRRRYNGISGDSPDGEMPLTDVHAGKTVCCSIAVISANKPSSSLAEIIVKIIIAQKFAHPLN